MVTKSGTNRNQGTAFYFGRYGGLLSENSTAPRTRTSASTSSAASFGGPIKRDKAFFFFSYDQNEEERDKSKAALTIRGDERRRRPTPAEHPGARLRPDRRRRLGVFCARPTSARVPRQGRHGAVAGASRLDPLCLLDGRAVQRHLRRADLDRHGERHRAGQQPFDRRAGQQRVRADAAERGQGAVRARAAAAAGTWGRICRTPRSATFPGGVDRSFRFGRPFFLPLDSATISASRSRTR